MFLPHLALLKYLHSSYYNTNKSKWITVVLKSLHLLVSPSSVPLHSWTSILLNSWEQPHCRPYVPSSFELPLGLWSFSPWHITGFLDFIHGKRLSSEFTSSILLFPLPSLEKLSPSSQSVNLYPNLLVLSSKNSLQLSRSHAYIFIICIVLQWGPRGKADMTVNQFQLQYTM